MPRYGTKSRKELTSCERDLQTIGNEAIKYYDHSILEGHRSPERSFELFKKGRKLIHPTLDPKDPDSYEIVGNVVTKVMVKSKHNYSPSKAFDAVPYPVDFDSDEVYALQQMIKSGESSLKLIMKAVQRLSQIRGRFYFMQGVFHTVAERLFLEGTTTHLIRGGHDWDRDGDFTDQNFDDFVVKFMHKYYKLFYNILIWTQLFYKKFYNCELWTEGGYLVALWTGYFKPF